MKNQNTRFYEIQFEIETECLLNCVHCSSAQSRSLNKRQYDDSDIINMLQLFRGNTHVLFTGGEPLLYRNLLPLCNQIYTFYEGKTTIGLYTTGNLSKMNPISLLLANQMKASGIKECYFSIYFTSENQHDVWTRKNGSFENTIKSILQTKKAGITPKGHLVLSRENMNFIPEIIKYYSDIGLEEIRILRLSPSGSAKESWEKIGLPLELQNQLISEILNRASSFSIPITVAGCPTIMPCRTFANAKGCQAGTNLLYVDANGDIYPCACTKRDPDRFIICNIKELDKLNAYLHQMETIEYYPQCFNLSNP